MPGATATGGKVTCIVTSLDLSGSSSTVGVNYSWSGSGGFTSSLQNPSVSSIGTYILTVTNPVNGCTSSATASVIQNIAVPGATASVDGILTCNTKSVTLLGQSTTPGVAYSWSGPLVFSSTEQNAVTNHPGTYTLTVTDPGNGCSSTSSIKVLKDTIGAYDVKATVSGAITCTIKSISITGTSSTSEATYDWTGPNGFKTTEQNIVTSTPGNYILHVGKPSNGCVVLTTATVLLDTIIPTGVVASVSGIISCTADSVVLTGSSTTSVATYKWEGAGFSSTMAVSKVSVPGVYTLMVSNPVNNCMKVASVTVILNRTLPTGVSTSVSGTLTCAAPNITVSATSATSGVVYSWSGPGTYKSNERAPHVSNPGIYTVTVTNPYNECSVSKTVEAQQNIITPEGITASVSNIITCLKKTAKLDCSSTTPSVTYSWTGPGGFTSTSQGPVVGISGTYTVTVGDPSNGCNVVKSVQVNQDTLPPANITATVSGTLNCSHSYVTLKGASSTVGVNYHWTGPNNFVADEFAPMTNFAGFYTLIVNNPNTGCNGKAAVTVSLDTVTPVSKILPVASPLALTTNTLTAQVVNNVVYSWVFSSANQHWSIVSGINTAGLTYVAGDASTSGNFYLTVTSTQNFCSGTSQVVLIAMAAKGAPLLPVQEDMGEKDFQVRAYPNPFSDKSTIEFIPLHDGHITVEILSDNGILVLMLFDGEVISKQMYKISVDGSEMIAGIYYLRISTPNKNEIYTKKLIVIK